MCVCARACVYVHTHVLGLNPEFLHTLYLGARIGASLYQFDTGTYVYVCYVGSWFRTEPID